MTDPHDPLDDALRDALHAEVAGAGPAGPDLLARVREARRPQPRRQVLTIAAAVVALVVIAAGLEQANRDGDEALDVVDDPSSTSTTLSEDVPVVCTNSPTGNPPCGDASAEIPERRVFVREDGWLVSMHLGSGEQDELYTAGDPRDEVEGGPSYVDGVELSPDREWVYFSICCEPAVGMTYRIPIGGGEREAVGYGYEPRVSPDGRFVATVSSQAIRIYDTTDLPEDGVPTSPGDHAEAALYDGADLPNQLAWSPDGTRLAFIDGYDDVGESPPTSRVLAWDGRELALDRDVGGDEADLVSWTPQGAFLTSDSFGLPAPRSVTHDTSYRWQLVVDAAGQVAYRDLPGNDPRPINGLPPVRLADW